MKIAIVDDEPDITELFSMACERQKDLEVLTFNDPLEALGEIGKQKIHIALIDLDMPGLTGDDMIRKCRNNYSWPMDFIICSGVKKITLAIRCYNLGASCLIVKPASLDTIQEAVERVLEKHRCWDRVIRGVTG